MRTPEPAPEPYGSASDVELHEAQRRLDRTREEEQEDLILRLCLDAESRLEALEGFGLQVERTLLREQQLRVGSGEWPLEMHRLHCVQSYFVLRHAVQEADTELEHTVPSLQGVIRAIVAARRDELARRAQR